MSPADFPAASEANAGRNESHTASQKLRLRLASHGTAAISVDAGSGRLATSRCPDVRRAPFPAKAGAPQVTDGHLERNAGETPMPVWLSLHHAASVRGKQKMRALGTVARAAAAGAA
jgi:hypothetical protein